MRCKRCIFVEMKIRCVCKKKIEGVYFLKKLMTVSHESANQRSYQRWLDKIIYKTKMKFWAVLGSWGCRKKKNSRFAGPETDLNFQKSRCRLKGRQQGLQIRGSRSSTSSENKHLQNFFYKHTLFSFLRKCIFCNALNKLIK